MIKYYVIIKGVLQAVDEKEVKEGSIDPHWIDVFHPSAEEKEILGKYLKASVSVDIDQLSKHKYHEKGGIFAHAHTMSEDKKLHLMTLILTPTKVITERYSTFKALEKRLESLKTNKVKAKNQNDIFLNLNEILTSHIEDNLEQISSSIDKITSTLFNATKGSVDHSKNVTIDFDKYMNAIGRNGDEISISQRSLLSMNRALRFLVDNKPFKFTNDEVKRASSLINDIATVEDHADIASDRMNFALNVCLGMIGIKQNLISKVLSIVSVTFLPPAVIAGLYGMNFHYMPELDWEYGYPMSIVLMVTFALVPLIYCKLKKWI